MCRGEPLAAVSNECRSVLPSTVTTPWQLRAKRCMKVAKQARNASQSSRRNTRLKVSWLGTLCGRLRNCLRKACSNCPNKATSGTALAAAVHSAQGRSAGFPKAGGAWRCRYAGPQALEKPPQTSRLQCPSAPAMPTRPAPFTSYCNPLKCDGPRVVPVTCSSPDLHSSASCRGSALACSLDTPTPSSRTGPVSGSLASRAPPISRISAASRIIAGRVARRVTSRKSA